MQKNNSLKIILASLIPLLILVGAVLFMGLNLGVDYATSNVISFQYSGDKSIDAIRENITELKRYDRIDTFADGKYQVYYQNVSLEELEALEDDIADNVGSISDFQVFVYNPTTLILIGGRIMYGLYAAVLIYLIYLAYILKGSGITRANLIWLLVGDLLLFGILIITTAGLINSLGYLGLNINSQIVSFGLTIFLYSILLNVLISRNFTIKSNSKLSIEWVDAVNSSKFGEIRNYLILGSTLVAYLALRMDYLLLVLVLAFTLLYSLLLHVFLKPLLIDWLINGGKNLKLISKNKRLSKEW